MTSSRSTLYAMAASGIAGVAMSLGMCAPAWSQDITPPIDAVGAYNHANVMTRRGKAADAQQARGRESSRQSAGQADGGTISRAAFDSIVADLRSEYNQRVARDGTPAADAWLQRNVAELKRRYTHIQD